MRALRPDPGSPTSFVRRHDLLFLLGLWTLVVAVVVLFWPSGG